MFDQRKKGNDCRLYVLFVKRFRTPMPFSNELDNSINTGLEDSLAIRLS